MCSSIFYLVLLLQFNHPRLAAKQENIMKSGVLWESWAFKEPKEVSIYIQSLQLFEESILSIFNNLLKHMIPRRERAMLAKAPEKEPHRKSFVEGKLEVYFDKFWKKDMQNYMRWLEKDHVEPSFSGMSSIRPGDRSMSNSDYDSLLGDANYQEMFQMHKKQKGVVSYTYRASEAEGQKKMAELQLKKEKPEEVINMVKKEAIPITETKTGNEKSQNVEPPTFKKVNAFGGMTYQLDLHDNNKKEAEKSMKKTQKRVEEIQKPSPKVQTLQKQANVEVKKTDLVLVNEKKKSEVKVQEAVPNSVSQKVKDEQEQEVVEEDSSPSYYDIIKEDEESYLASQQIPLSKPQEFSSEKADISTDNKEMSSEEPSDKQRSAVLKVEEKDVGKQFKEREEDSMAEEERKQDPVEAELLKEESKQMNEESEFLKEEKGQTEKVILEVEQEREKFIQIQPELTQSGRPQLKTGGQIKQTSEFKEVEESSAKQAQKEEEPQTQPQESIQPQPVNSSIQQEQTFTTVQEVDASNTQFQSFSNNHEEEAAANINPDFSSLEDKALTKEISSSSYIKEEEQNDTLESRIDILMENFYSIINEESFCDNCQETLKQKQKTAMQNRELTDKVAQLIQTNDKLRINYFELEMKVKSLEQKLQEIQEKNENFGENRAGLNGRKRKYSSELQKQNEQNEASREMGSMRDKLEKRYNDDDEESQKNSSELEEEEEEEEEKKKNRSGIEEEQKNALPNGQIVKGQDSSNSDQS